MAEQDIFERLLVLRAFQQKPLGVRIGHAVAECDVQSEGHLVNEVVVVAFAAPVVVTGEEHAPAAV